MQAIFVALGLLATAYAQTVSILTPGVNQTLTPGTNFTVQILKPVRRSLFSRFICR